MTEAEDERSGELDTLRAIYADNMVVQEGYSGYIEVPVALQAPLRLSCVDKRSDEHKVSHLPLTRVCFDMPEGYPNTTAPCVRLKAYWLPDGKIQALQKFASILWEEYGRTEVLYAHINHVQEIAELAFGLERLEVVDDLSSRLLDYDRDAKQHDFEKWTYECGVCLDPKEGPSCHRMIACGHVFCIDCLQGYFNAILTGNIDHVKCLAYKCGMEGEDENLRRAKTARPITPRELLYIPIERPAVQPYVNLKRKRRLETDRQTVWCPRKWCQSAAKGKKHPKPSEPLEEMGSVFEDSAVPTPQNEQVETANSEDEQTAEQKLLCDRLRICEECEYAFCRLCKHSWHGDFFDCRAQPAIKPKRDIKAEEEEASLEFIRQNTTKCPKCESPVQKSEACNHMTCVKCRTHFCYLCSAFLDPCLSYNHFNQQGSWCYQRLWEGEDGEDVER